MSRWIVCNERKPGVDTSIGQRRGYRREYFMVPQGKIDIRIAQKPPGQERFLPARYSSGRKERELNGRVWAYLCVGRVRIGNDFRCRQRIWSVRGVCAHIALPPSLLPCKPYAFWVILPLSAAWAFFLASSRCAAISSTVLVCRRAMPWKPSIVFTRVPFRSASSNRAFALGTSAAY